MHCQINFYRLDSALRGCACLTVGRGETVPHVWGVLSERLPDGRQEVSAEGGLAPLAEVRWQLTLY